MLRKTLFASLLLAVVSAGAVTVKQLTSQPKFGVCKGTCSTTQPCTSGPCFCYIPSGTSGFCVSDPPGVKK